MRALGAFKRCKAAAHNSSTLCEGMLVAMPTAMPEAPLAKRFGNAAGKTIGSSSHAKTDFEEATTYVSATILGCTLHLVLLDRGHGAETAAYHAGRQHGQGGEPTAKGTGLE